jgi:hypothetical protein
VAVRRCRARERDGLGLVLGEGLLAAGPAAPQLVEADPADDGGEPAAEVLDAFGVAGGQPEPGLLDGVLGLAGGAEHLEGHGLQSGPVRFEAAGEPLVVVHPGSSSIGFEDMTRPAPET